MGKGTSPAPGPVRRNVVTLASLLALLLLGCSEEPLSVPERVFPAQDPTGKHSDRLPNILLRTQDNQSVRFYDDLISDRSVFINFMYTTCPLICPGTTANLVKVHALLGDRMGEDILMLSISLDPETDTPEQLKHYAGLFGDKKGWLYLTGDYEEIDLLRHRLGVYDPHPIIDAAQTQHGRGRSSTFRSHGRDPSRIAKRLSRRPDRAARRLRELPLLLASPARSLQGKRRAGGLRDDPLALRTR